GAIHTHSHTHTPTHTHTHTHTHTSTQTQPPTQTCNRQDRRTSQTDTATHKQTVTILKYNHTDTVSPCKEHANIYNVCSVTKTMHAIIFGHKAEGKISPKAFQEAHKPHFC